MIRSILDLSNAAVKKQSLAEATIPAGAWHQIRTETGVRMLCCCAPPYRHEDTFFD